MSGSAKRHPWKWYAALLVLAGTFLPWPLYVWEGRQFYPEHYLAWEEGIGFVCFAAAAATALLLYIAALFLVFQRSDRPITLWRVVAVGLLLALAAGLVIWSCVSVRTLVAT